MHYLELIRKFSALAPDLKDSFAFCIQSADAQSSTIYSIALIGKLQLYLKSVDCSENRKKQTKRIPVTLVLVISKVDKNLNILFVLLLLSYQAIFNALKKLCHHDKPQLGVKISGLCSSRVFHFLQDILHQTTMHCTRGIIKMNKHRSSWQS
jgi:hypothetical protein